MEISLENFYVDTGASRVNVEFLCAAKSINLQACLKKHHRINSGF